MKKIPSLFVREFEAHKIKAIKPDLTSADLQVVLDGKCVPTLKIDGACCAFLGGVFYKRYDAKAGKTPPANAVPCCKPDPVTGHWPHWVPVCDDSKADKWFLEAKKNFLQSGNILEEGTYEAIGKHFQGNPYGLEMDTLRKHGDTVLEDLKDVSFDGIRRYLKEHDIEGIVFWYHGEPLCKIKRSDFGLVWKDTKPRKK